MSRNRRTRVSGNLFLRKYYSFPLHLLFVRNSRRKLQITEGSIAMKYFVLSIELFFLKLVDP